MTFLCIECGKNLDESMFYRKVKNECKDCLKKKLKCQLCTTFFTTKWLTTHIEREHENEYISSVFKKPKIGNVTNRTLFV